MTTLPRIQDDLYLAINGEWQQSAVIPPDKSAIGADSDLGDDIRAKLIADLTAIAAGKETVDQPVQLAAQLYALAADKATRDQTGIAPVLPRLQVLEQVDTLAALKAQLPQLVQNDYTVPFGLYVGADRHDATVNQLQLYGPETILPDAAMYHDGVSAENQHLLDVWADMARQLLQAAGYDAATAATYVTDALAFDARLGLIAPTNEEMAVDANWDHPEDWATLAAQTANIGLTDAILPLLPSQPTTVNAMILPIFTHYGELLNADNYHEWQHRAIIEELLDAAGYLSDELRQLGGTYDRLLSGQEAPTAWSKHAFSVTNAFLAEPIGLYYGRKYFGEAAKADITQMVRDLIATYKAQLSRNSWLSAATREKAIAKLDTMVIKMGYPDQVFPLYDTLHFAPTDDLYTAVTALSHQTAIWWLAQVGQPVDRSEWAMPGHLVNACYDPSKNDITFPAGILQPPYYALDWTTAEKLGGTGVTIGHEISHSFDNNGALYDAAGTMNDWWQPADKAAFDQLVTAVAEQFDGRKYEGATINGRLTVSENIADNAGMDVALELLGKAASQADREAFFATYAKSWAMKMRPAMAKTRAQTDVHAPASLRVNVPVMNFTAWYETYGVQPSDGEYLAPADRITIWDK